MNMGCPVCGGPSLKVLYGGIPLRLCEDEACSHCFGRMAWIFNWVPYNGVFLVYDRYWPALWAFLRGRS